MVLGGTIVDKLHQFFGRHVDSRRFCGPNVVSFRPLFFSLHHEPGREHVLARSAIALMLAVPGTRTRVPVGLRLQPDAMLDVGALHVRFGPQVVAGAGLAHDADAFLGHQLAGIEKGGGQRIRPWPCRTAARGGNRRRGPGRSRPGRGCPGRREPIAPRRRSGRTCGDVRGVNTGLPGRAAVTTGSDSAARAPARRSSICPSPEKPRDNSGLIRIENRPVGKITSHALDGRACRRPRRSAPWHAAASAPGCESVRASDAHRALRSRCDSRKPGPSSVTHAPASGCRRAAAHARTGPPPPRGS